MNYYITITSLDDVTYGDILKTKNFSHVLNRWTQVSMYQWNRMNGTRFKRTQKMQNQQEFKDTNQDLMKKMFTWWVLAKSQEDSGKKPLHYLRTVT